MCDGCEGISVNQKYYPHEVPEPTKEDLLLKSLCIPTQIEIRSQLGSRLAEIFFEDLSSEGRVILGLVPPLIGPDEVWITPSSRLKNKVLYKPVPEPKALHLKCFTHQTILELGQRYIDRLQSSLGGATEEALERQKEELEEEFKKRLQEALSDAKAEADDQCRQVVGTMMEHFDRCFNELAETYKLRTRKKCQLRVEEERSDLASYMLTQLENEVAKRDLELCSDFHDTLHGELNALSARYIQQIDSERRAAREVLEELVQKYERMMVNIRCEMEINNLVDVCRAVSEEKAKEEGQRRDAETAGRDQILELTQKIESLTEKNRTLQKMATERSQRIEKYRSSMRLLIEEFQKFVNFALKAVPGHAEFLLSTQKMILRNYQEDNLLLPEDYEEYKRCLEGKQWEKSKDSPESFSQEYETVSCFFEEEEEERKSSLDTLEKYRQEKDSPYAFNYYKFKYHLLKNLIKGVQFRPPPKSEEQKKISTPEEPKEQDVLPGEGFEEYKQTLTLVGENIRDHIQPVRTFLCGRMKNIAGICRDNPDLAKMMLGRPCRPLTKKPDRRSLPSRPNSLRPCLN